MLQAAPRNACRACCAAVPAAVAGLSCGRPDPDPCEDGGTRVGERIDGLLPRLTREERDTRPRGSYALPD